jgi:hypothetical protein
MYIDDHIIPLKRGSGVAESEELADNDDHNTPLKADDSKV